MSDFLLARIRSRKEIFDFLEILGGTGSIDRPYAKYPKIKELIDEAETLFEAYQKTHYELSRAEITLKVKKKYHSEARQDFVQMIRDFWSVMEKLHRRKRYPNELKHHYLYAYKKGLPKTNTLKKWGNIAYRMIEGDRFMINAGYVGMSNPTPQELQASMDRVERYDYASDEYGFKELKRELQAQIKDAQYIHSSLARVMRRIFKDDPPQRLRAHMRIMGLRFTNVSKLKQATEDLGLPEIEEAIPMEDFEPLKLEAPSVFDQLEQSLREVEERLLEEMAPTEE